MKPFSLDAGLIDWGLLRDQKNSLLRLLDWPTLPDGTRNSLLGILTLIDYVQDRAADTVLSPDEVFGGEGQCDYCDFLYDIGDREDHCGDCGTCWEHCPEGHAPEVTA